MELHQDLPAAIARSARNAWSQVGGGLMYFPQYIYLGNEEAGLVQRVEAGRRDIKVGQPDDQPTKRALKGWPSAMPNPTGGHL